MPKINIDGKEFEIDDMSDELKQELNMVLEIDKKLRENEVEKAILMTAKNAFSAKINSMMAKEESKQAKKISTRFLLTLKNVEYYLLTAELNFQRKAETSSY